MGQTREEIQEIRKITQLENNIEKKCCQIIYLTDEERRSKCSDCQKGKVSESRFLKHSVQIEDIRNYSHSYILIHWLS